MNTEFAVNNYPLQHETFKIIGVAMEIHRILAWARDFLRLFRKMHLSMIAENKIFAVKEKKNTSLIIKAKYYPTGFLQTL